MRPENNIGYTVLTVDDYQSSAYIDTFDTLEQLVISMRYGSASYNVVFRGVQSNVRPRLSPQGEVLDVSAWGSGNALPKTHCDESYGVESIDNSAIDTPKEIIDDFITNHINKEFGGVASGWSIGNKVENIHSGLSVTHLNSQYLNNFVNVNRICDLTNAYAQGLPTPEVSIHWYVDSTASANLYVKKIDANHSDNLWDRYWGGIAGTSPGTQASSTIEVSKDMILYDFRKNVDEYANSVLLASKLRIPAEDYLCEDGGPTWSTVDATATYDNTQFVVGSHSLLVEPTASPAIGTAFYPPKTLLTGDAAAGQKIVAVTSVADLKIGDNVTIWDNTPTTETATIASIAALNLTMTANLTNAYQVADAAYVRRNAKWDFTKCGSQDNIPTFNFYVRANDVNAFGHAVFLCTDRIPLVGGAATDYFWTYLSEYMTPVADKWVHISLPIGPYYAIQPELQLDTGANEFEWNVVNNADWAEINFICLDLTGNNNYDKWFDDMHFSGKIIREARDTSEITANNVYQKVIRNDTAVNDTLRATDDSGTAARLAYAELLRRSQTPIVGMIQTPLAPNLLPGQTVHIHAGLKRGFKTTDANAFRINSDFRVKELRHTFDATTGARTIMNLTSDVTNSHAFAVPTQYSLLKQYAGALAHSEARNLKGGGIDNLIPRLSKNY